MEATTTGPVHFLNVEYFFRLIYECATGGCTGGAGIDFLGFLAHVWFIVTIVSVIITALLLFAFVYSSIRYYQILEEEKKKFVDLEPTHAEVERDHHRWDHVRTLIASPNESDWRQAIIEADIMLDDLLSQLGYPGQGVGEKLRAVDPSRMQTLQEAWEGHKVRNEIAHQGYAFQLTEQMAQRTIAHFEAVMREFGEI